MVLQNQQNFSEPLFCRFTSMCLSVCRRTPVRSKLGLQMFVGPEPRMQQLSVLSISSLEFLLPEMPELHAAQLPGRFRTAEAAVGTTALQHTQRSRTGIS